MRIQLINDSSVGKNDFQADTISVHTTLLDELDSTGVCGQIAAYLTAALRAKIQWHHITAIFRVVLQSLQNGTSLRPQNALGRIEPVNRIHLFGADDDLVVERDATADKPGVAALRHDRNHAIVAVLKAPRNLLSRGW